MVALVDSEDLADWLGIASAALDVARAELTLEAASNLIRQELDQALDYVDADTIDVIARGGTTLLLPELPVWSVASVAEKRPTESTFTSLAELVDYGLELGHDYREGIIRRLNGRWARGYTYRVVYAHGYATLGDTGTSAEALPGAIVAVALRVAGRAYSNPTGLRQRSIGRYSETDGATTPGLYLTSADKHDLDGFYPGHRAGAR